MRLASPATSCSTTSGIGRSRPSLRAIASGTSRHGSARAGRPLCSCTTAWSICRRRASRLPSTFSVSPGMMKATKILPPPTCRPRKRLSSSAKSSTTTTPALRHRSLRLLKRYRPPRRLPRPRLRLLQPLPFGRPLLCSGFSSAPFCAEPFRAPSLPRPSGRGFLLPSLFLRFSPSIIYPNAHPLLAPEEVPVKRRFSIPV